MRSRTPKSLLSFVLIAVLITAGQSYGVDKRTLDITKINVSGKPRPAKCYSTKIGGYDCLQLGVVIIFKRKTDGKTASISTSHLLTGSYVQTVREEFGDYAPMYFESAKLSLNSLFGNYQAPPDIQLNASNMVLMHQFVKLLNKHSSNVDFAKTPEAFFNIQALNALYGITEALLRADTNAANQGQQLNDSINLARTLGAIFKNGADVGTTLIPFVNDARDYYELTTGRDLITGESIGYDGRFLCAIAMIGGSGGLYRKALDKLKATFWTKTARKALEGIPGLTYQGKGVWTSKEGLIYLGVKGNKENRLRHILHHGIKNKNMPGKSLFNTKSIKDVPALIDKAWKKRGASDVSQPGKYVIDMGVKVGTKGQTKITIVVEPQTTKLITAFPSK